MSSPKSERLLTTPAATSRHEGPLPDWTPGAPRSAAPLVCMLSSCSGATIPFRSSCQCRLAARHFGLNRLFSPESSQGSRKNKFLCNPVIEPYYSTQQKCHLPSSAVGRPDLLLGLQGNRHLPSARLKHTNTGMSP